MKEKTWKDDGTEEDPGPFSDNNNFSETLGKSSISTSGSFLLTINCSKYTVSQISLEYAKMLTIFNVVYLAPEG